MIKKLIILILVVALVLFGTWKGLTQYQVNIETTGGEAEKVSAVPGLYKTGSNYTVMLKSWDELVSEGTIPVIDGVIDVIADGASVAGDLVIPDSVTSIGDYAFHNCRGLTNVVIPDSVTSLGACAFCWCTNLTSVVIPDSVTSIDYMAFDECTSLTSVVIGDGVTSIGYRAFSYCTSLTSVVIGDGVTGIKDNAFEYCTGLTNVEIGSGVTKIGKYTFQGCSNLSSITIPASVTSIGYSAFSYCTGLTSIAFDGTTARWTAISNGDNWNQYVPATEVICSDGVVALNAW